MFGIKKKKYEQVKKKVKKVTQVPEFVKKLRDLGGTEINIEKIKKDK